MRKAVGFHFTNFIKSRNYIVLITVFLLLSKLLFSQSNRDTLQLSKAMNDNKEFDKAEKLLAVYSKSHPNDFNVLWVYALTERWLKKYKHAKRLYIKAIKLKPDNLYLQIDYVKELIEMGNMNEASKLLLTLRKNNLVGKEATFLLAKITYWLGNYTAAYDSITYIYKKDTTVKVKQLNNDIVAAKAPWVKLSTQYYSDNQPIQKTTPAMEVGWAVNTMLNLRLNLLTPFFTSGTTTFNAQWFQLGNKFIFNKINAEALFDIGVFNGTYRPNTSLTGNIYVKKNITRKLIMDAQVAYKPYYNTIKSLDTICYFTHYASSLAWQNPASWNGKLNFDYNQFKDNNYTYALYGWVFTPPLVHVPFIELRLGYAYSFSNSKDNRYDATQSVSTIVANYLTTTSITGIYNPYFTPNHQNIHSALASVALHPSKKIDAGVNANLGVYAYTQNPYLFLDKNNSGELFINRGYANKNYTPFETNAFMAFQLNKKLNLRVDYTYRVTFFYTYWSAGLTLKIVFLDGKKWL